MKHMRNDYDPPVYGDIREETAHQCEGLSCRLFSRLSRADNIPTCFVYATMDNGRTREIAVGDYRSKIPKNCPEFADDVLQLGVR